MSQAQTSASATTPLDPPATSEHGVLPLAPIEKPKSLFIRLLYWVTRRRYGKTPTAFRVMYARAPFIGVFTLVLITFLEKATTIPYELNALLRLSIANQKGCTFCQDLGLAELVRAGVGTERFADLGDHERSDAFSDAEKAALGYASHVEGALHVPDAIFDRLREHFSERAITEIVWVCAVERYFNSMAIPLRIGSDHLAQAMRAE
jgi:alkylhydroperoxidase family enzyme